MRFVTMCTILSPKDIIETGEIYDCVIIGGGISGLAAALFFQRSALRNELPDC